MAPWPAPGSVVQVVGWRLDQEIHGASWDAGIGAEKFGGRWNSRGIKVVYASLDPGTAILEVAAHKGFAALDTVRHVLTAFSVSDPRDVFVVQPHDVPNAGWLWPGTPSGAQQLFGDALLAKHHFVLIPSAVSSHSWNLLFNPVVAAGKYKLVMQEPFAMDTRLNPAPPSRP